MRIRSALQSGVAVNAVAAAALALSLSAGAAQAQQPNPAQNASQVAVDSDDIGGVVIGPDGPEAGVWVIAETTDLPTTKLAKIVVTDDAGRYLVPDLPKAKYKVWVRGYGLVDSPKVDAEPGQQLNLTAVKAPNDAAAAQYYPAIYWYSMLQDSGSEPVRRQERHPGKSHADRVAARDQEPGLHRLPSDRAARDPDDPGGVRHRRGRLDAPRPIRPGGGTDDQSAGRATGRGTVQIFRRLDRPGRQRRTAGQQAAAAAGPRAQRRGHHLGMG